MVPNCSFKTIPDICLTDKRYIGKNEAQDFVPQPCTLTSRLLLFR